MRSVGRWYSTVGFLHVRAYGRAARVTPRPSTRRELALAVALRLSEIRGL